MLLLLSRTRSTLPLPFSPYTGTISQTSLLLRKRSQQAVFSTSSTANIVQTSVDARGIARVCLSRPEKLNALDLPLFEAISNEATRLRSDRSIRAVILSGHGRAFCTGLDVKTIVKDNPKKTVDRLLERPQGSSGNLAQDVGYLWRDLPVPVIAVLHGMCYGGGMQIALGADFRFASPDCKLSIMEAKWGK
jgi:enoyl-CoA hydratase/carnithine racemase